ncbi:MAG: hypothetical protein M3R59_05745 [Verrucomicrobiota bacterium]|nr:hypothetical protein [Verrucomicrobiota bacterium]
MRDDFLSWVRAPERTADELFTVELLLETQRRRGDWPIKETVVPYDEEDAMRRARAANPAYRPTLHEGEMQWLARHAAEVKFFRSRYFHDRPVRDLAALRFFPGLEQVDVSSGEVRDYSPLAGLAKVQWLTIMDGNFPGASHPMELAQCGAKPEMIRLTLSLRHPWPDLRGAAQWPVQEARFLTINPLALAEVAELPEAVLVEINSHSDGLDGLRDLRKFPAMPKVKRLRLYRTASLEGIERYPTLLNLEIGGHFEDLEPLTRLPNLTALTLRSEHLEDLTPLTRMPKLRELHFMREKPLDLGALIEAHELRRIRFSHCAIMRMEVAALNAGLLPEAPDFETAEPRSLAPLQFFHVSSENEAGRKFFNDRQAAVYRVREEFYDGDEMLKQAEGRVFRHTVHQKLNAHLGRGWGAVTIHEGLNTPGQLMLTFKRYQDTMRLRPILELLRQESARARFPWVFWISVEPHGDMTMELEDLRKLEEQEREPDEYWLAKYYRPESTLKENAERLEFFETRYEFLQQEYLRRLREEQGIELAQPTAPPTAASPEDEIEELEEPLSASADDETGGVALAPPPPAPEGTEDLSDQLSFSIQLFEDCIMVAGERRLDAARYNLGQAPVEWSPEQMRADRAG